MPRYFTDRRRASNRRLKPLPQFELPRAEAVFNLASETATDGDRLAREAEAQTKAQQQQDQQQQNLL
jgi:hypothetical protein